MASEIATLRTQIEQELEAMRAGLFGLSEGTSRHQFINMKMCQVGLVEEALARHVGDAQATQAVCQMYHKVMEERTPQ